MEPTKEKTPLDTCPTKGCRGALRLDHEDDDTRWLRCELCGGIRVLARRAPAWPGKGEPAIGN